MQSMKIRKPVELSERCGVITAEKIAVSAGAAALWLASVSMTVIISAPSKVFYGAQKTQSNQEVGGKKARPKKADKEAQRPFAGRTQGQRGARQTAQGTS